MLPNRLTKLCIHGSPIYSGGEFVPLGEEIALIESYLDIERARFEERLKISIEVPDELYAIQIPPLLIQPLVENAIKHGIGPSRLGGHLTIGARIEDLATDGHSQILCITVRDTGAGASEIEMAHGRRRGLGITNVEQRLKSYFGDVGHLTIESTRGSGTTVEARVPLYRNLSAPEMSTDSNQRRRA
jgi:two-component system LytT family sensor kinase